MWQAAARVTMVAALTSRRCWRRSRRRPPRGRGASRYGGRAGLDGGGWFAGRERGLRELRRAIDQVVADRPVGVLGYEYVTTADGSAWVPVDGRPLVRRALAVLAALAGIRSS